MQDSFTRHMLKVFSRSRAAAKQDLINQKNHLNLVRKEALIKPRSKEERYWDFRYDPNRQRQRHIQEFF
jgi:hypothetical protein